MKKGIILFFCVALLSTSLIAKGNGQGSQTNNTSNLVITVTGEELSQEQEAALVFMYQEEKLARDTYITLAEKWDLNIFNNIKSAEQKHMDALKNLLQAYNVPVPVIEDEVGVFEDAGLQDLYNQLIQRGLESQEEALNVGISVEEIDIADLEARMESATSETQRIFSYLLKASQNHLKAFNRVLESIATP